MSPVSESDSSTSCVYSCCTALAQGTDSGQWRCEVTNNYGRSAADFSVKVLDKKHIVGAEPPQFKSSLDNVLVDEDDSATFKCEVTGRPTPDVRWFRDEIPIEEGRPGYEEFKIYERDGYQTLRIKRAKVRDSAVYKCKITNVAGWASCDAKLYVKEGKGLELLSFSKNHEYSLVDQIKERRGKDGTHNEADTLVRFYDSATISKFLLKWDIDADQTLGFAEHLKSKCSVEGNLASLSCFVRGIPPFKVRWYKNNTEIFDGGKYFIRNQRGFLSLEIPLTREEDTGNYMCEVRNSQGKIYSSCYLQCEPTLEITNEVPTKPIFVKPMKRLTVDEGELIRFRVTVKGYPAPGFKWFKDGLEMHDSERITTEMMPNGVAQLVIERATVRDIGLYTCEAHNLAGRARSMVKVSVRDKFEAESWNARSVSGAEVKTEGKYDIPVDTITNTNSPTINFIPRQHNEEFTYKPIFTHLLPHNLTIRNKGRFILECCCNSIPRPKVTWFKDDKRIVEGPRYNFLSLGDWFGLEIVEGEIADSGIYTVKIKNEKGEVASSCEVEMKLPTEKPRTVNMPIETAYDVSKRSDRQVAVQSEEEGLFDYVEVVPSCRLCNTEHDWTALIEREVEVVEAEESPSFPDVLPDKITPPENAENVTLTCKVQGNPIPRVVWFKDGKVLDSPAIHTSLDMEARTAVLVIKKLTENEAGQYTCVAYSENGGHATTTTEVQFRDTKAAASSSDAVDAGKMSLPEFKVKLEDRNAAVGSQLKLEVITDGCPKPQVQWFKNGQQIEPNLEKYSIQNSEEGGHALVITRVHVSDADCYKCVAVNECGMVSTSAHVCVQEKCTINSSGETERPTFKEPLHSLVSKQGEDVVFKCVANGNPQPTLTWLRDTTPLTSDDRVVISNTDGESSLTIKNVSISDAGLYICVAENEEGKVESCSSLQVIGGCVSQEANGSSVTDATDASSQGGKGNPGETVDAAGSITNQQEVLVDSTVNGGAAVPAIDIKDFDFLKRPKFIARPLTQWVVADDELYLSVEVAQAENTVVNWYHNGKQIQKGRFRFEVKEKAV